MAKKKPKSKVKELDASNGLIDISETSQKDDVKQESKWQSFKKRLRNEDDEPVIQFEGKFKDNKFLDDIRPKEGYCFRSDYFEIDDKYAKIVTFVNKGSSKKTLPIFWGINLIPQGVQQDVTIVLLKSVDRMTDAWIEDHQQTADNVTSFNENETKKSTDRKAKHEAEHKSTEIDIIAKELMDVDKLTYSKMLEQKKITQEEYDCLLLKKVTTGLGYREIAEAIKVDGTLYCDDDMVKVMHSDRFRELYTDANIQYIINSEGYIRNKQNGRIQNLYIYEDDIPIYDKNNLNMKVLLKLQRMKNVNDLIDSNYDEKSDMFDSEKMIMNIASKYEFNPENTKIVSTARIGMIYSEDDKCVEIGDLVTAPIKDNLTFEDKKKMSRHIVNQIKKSLMQIDIGNCKVDLSKLDESQRGLLINLINQVRNRHYDCDYIMN